MYTIIPQQLTPKQYQQVLDAYGVGRLNHVVPLPPASPASEPIQSLSNALITTARGTFLLSYAPDEQLHDLWWSSPSEEAFPLSLMDRMKLTYVQPMATRQDLFTVHRFDRRFTLFAL